MSDDNKSKREEDLSNMQNDDIQMIPDSTLEKKIFLYGSILNLCLWVYVFIFFQEDGSFFVIPAIIMTIAIVFLYIRYFKRKSSTEWVETSFQEYKAKHKKKIDEE